MLVKLTNLMVKPIYIVNPKVSWASLSRNPNAIHILEQNLNKVSWWRLSENPNAIHLLEQNLDKVHWALLSMNPNAIPLLSKIDYEQCV